MTTVKKISVLNFNIHTHCISHSFDMVTSKALNANLTLKHNILHTLSPGRCQNVGVWQNIQHGVKTIWNWSISKHMSMQDHANKTFSLQMKNRDIDHRQWKYAGLFWNLR